MLFIIYIIFFFFQLQLPCLFVCFLFCFVLELIFFVFVLGRLNSLNIVSVVNCFLFLLCPLELKMQNGPRTPPLFLNKQKQKKTRNKKNKNKGRKSSRKYTIDCIMEITQLQVSSFCGQN